MRLMLSSMDALMHRNILVAQSGFFTAKLSDRWSNQRWTLSHINQISDWDNVEVYVETLRLIRCKDLTAG
uniref:Uncharacterized protein n=1 Tax=Aegilops tauschii subsp. strangulata TaxID=200361 RepID=A0A453BGF3_AEGTS